MKVPNCRISCSTMPGEGMGSSRSVSTMKSTAATVTRSPRAVSMPAAVSTTVSTSFNLLVDRLLRRVLAKRSDKLPLVHHHGDGDILDLVAIADRGGLLGVQLEIRKIFLALFLAFGAVARERGSLIAGNVLLHRDIAAVAGVLRRAGFLHIAHRTLDARIRVVFRFVDLLLVGVQPRRDADLEIVERRDRGSASCAHCPAIRRRRSFPARPSCAARCPSISPPAARIGAVGVEHRHLVGRQRRDRGGDQLTDRAGAGEMCRRLPSA